MNPEDRAADLLIHYMRTAWEAAGLHWEPDNSTEIRIIFDHLMAAVTQRVARLNGGA
jgi:hypothetical protein